MIEKQVNFLQLIKKVRACRKCVRMEHSERVLSSACGSLDASVFFIGEAPGRLGADDSQIPFHGDKSGHNFESLLEQVGLSRYDVFVTNAVLCNPRDEFGNNSTPSPQEIRNCAPFLAAQIDLVQPKVIATLGATALRSCELVESHGLAMRSAVRTVNKWRGSALIPIYHPGQRAMMHRSFANQLADYQFIHETIHKKKNRIGKKKSFPKSSEKVCSIVDFMTQKKTELSYFALHKLLFLAEVHHLETAGKRLTPSYIVRQKDGPYCVELHPQKLRKGIPDLVLKMTGTKLILQRSVQASLLDATDFSKKLHPSEIQTINLVLQQYGSLTDSELKTAAYLKRPMRDLLRKEKLLRANLFNSPLLNM